MLNFFFFFFLLSCVVKIVSIIGSYLLNVDILAQFLYKLGLDFVIIKVVIGITESL